MMDKRDLALESLKRLSKILPERVFMDADGGIHVIMHGNNRNTHKLRNEEVLRIIHASIREHVILEQIVVCQDQNPKEADQ